MLELVQDYYYPNFFVMLCFEDYIYYGGKHYLTLEFFTEIFSCIIVCSFGFFSLSFHCKALPPACTKFPFPCIILLICIYSQQTGTIENILMIQMMSNQRYVAYCSF